MLDRGLDQKFKMGRKIWAGTQRYRARTKLTKSKTLTILKKLLPTTDYSFTMHIVYISNVSRLYSVSNNSQLVFSPNCHDGEFFSPSPAAAHPTTRTVAGGKKFYETGSHFAARDIPSDVCHVASTISKQESLLPSVLFPTTDSCSTMYVLSYCCTYVRNSHDQVRVLFFYGSIKLGFACPCLVLGHGGAKGPRRQHPHGTMLPRHLVQGCRTTSSPVASRTARPWQPLAMLLAGRTPRRWLFMRQHVIAGSGPTPRGRTDAHQDPSKCSILSHLLKPAPVYSMRP